MVVVGLRERAQNGQRWRGWCPAGRTVLGDRPPSLLSERLVSGGLIMTCIAVACIDSDCCVNQLPRWEKRGGAHLSRITPGRWRYGDKF
jgi:hypothetical protein